MNIVFVANQHLSFVFIFIINWIMNNDDQILFIAYLMCIFLVRNIHGLWYPYIFILSPKISSLRIPPST